MSEAGIDFSKVLTPELLDATRKLYFPWAEDATLDFTTVARKYFGTGPDEQAWYKLVYHQALKPLSTVGVEHVPDLMQFLPAPHTKEFAAQALGLLVLLDQGPRALLGGVNGRYTYDYFDRLTSTLARQLFALPDSHNPYNIQWLIQQGWSFDYAIVALIWLTAPFVHSESVEDHERHLVIAERMRKAVEEHTGTTDPHRVTEEEDLKDVLGFMRIVMSVPKWENTKVEEFLYWLLRLFRVHTPIVKKYGHYPYRNSSLGRPTSEEEEQFLKDTHYFAVLQDKEAVKHIQCDVDEGKWSPLEDPMTNGSG